MGWYLSSPITNDWIKADEGSFTFEVPTSLKRQAVQPIDSHCGEYLAGRMRLDFDEVHGLGYTKQIAQAKHDELERDYAKQHDATNTSKFLLKLGKRYARITAGSDKKWVKEGYPGKYAVKFFCPDPAGSYLSISITYQDEKETDIALRIIKSVQVK